VAIATAPAEQAALGRNEHPLLVLTARRLAIGVLTLFLVSVIVFLATEVLPGNAAFAVLGRSANPARLHALEHQLHLDQGVLAQYWTWLSGLFTGKLGTSLANGEPVWGLVEPRLINSAVLVGDAAAWLDPVEEQALSRPPAPAIAPVATIPRRNWRRSSAFPGFP